MRVRRHGEQLWQKIGLVKPYLNVSAHAFWTHPRLAEMLPEFYFALYSSVRSSVPLMETARDCACSRAGSDPVATQTAEYLAVHIREELHHDEWLLEDMLAMGMDRATILRRPPPPAIAALVGAQYYWVLHSHPVAVLGYLAVLEGDPPSAAQVSDIQARTGLPPQAFRTLLKHAQLDPHHSQQLKRTLDQMPLQQEHTTLLGFSAFHTIQQLTHVFEEILEIGEVCSNPLPTLVQKAQNTGGKSR